MSIDYNIKYNFFSIVWALDKQIENELILINNKTLKNNYPETGPLVIKIEDAILIGLDNNRSLKIEKLKPKIQKTYENEEQGVFDPVISAKSSIKREVIENTSNLKTKDIDTEVNLSKFFATGTKLELKLNNEISDSNTIEDQEKIRTGISITQSLMQGFSKSVNLAKIQQARIDTFISQYQLRGFCETLVSNIEKACWDYILNQKQIEIFTDSLTFAENQLWEIKERIKVGKLPKIERYAAEAEVARRREALINAKNDFEISLLKLQRFLNFPKHAPWNRNITILDKPEIPDEGIENVDNHVVVALKWRPEIKQMNLQLKQGDIEIVKTKNGILPKLDLFINMGKSGYSQSFSSSIRDLEGQNYDISCGISFEYPVNRSGSKAIYKRAVLNKKLSEEALINLTQLIEFDVRTAYINVKRTREQITASAATLKYQKETLRAENEKFKVGKSTSLLVAQAQRDFVNSQISNIDSKIGYLKALIDFYHLEGSLLERRGVGVKP